MICVLGLSREVAKALLIDSAAGWCQNRTDMDEIGYGIVPKSIEDVVHAKRDDEIRFVIMGRAKAYETYTYNLPIPNTGQKFPFFARVTLVYFPVCNRQQGVDYTTTEMDVHFGRLKMRDGKPVIEDISRNRQADEGVNVLYEKDARPSFGNGTMSR